MQTIVTALRSLNTIRSFPIFGETDVNEQLDKTAIYSRAGTLWQSWIGDVVSICKFSCSIHRFLFSVIINRIRLLYDAIE